MATLRESVEDDFASLGGDFVANSLRLAAHPDFPQAARALAANMLTLGDADPALGGIFRDAGRYVAAMCAAYLHNAGGLTLPRLKAMCAATGYLSPGRARSIIHYLIHIGYVEAAPSGGGRGGPVTYRPTPSFFAGWRAHVLAALVAASIIDPGIGTLLARLCDGGVFETFLLIQVSRLYKLAAEVNQTPAYVRVFQHRNAGTQILWTLLSAEDAHFPARRPQPIVIAQLSRRFGVSHVHIRRLLNDAVDAGLIRRDAKGNVIFEASACDTIRFHYAAQIAELIGSAAETIATLDAPLVMSGPTLDMAVVMSGPTLDMAVVMSAPALDAPAMASVRG